MSELNPPKPRGFIQNPDLWEQARLKGERVCQECHRPLLDKDRVKPFNFCKSCCPEIPADSYASNSERKKWVIRRTPTGGTIRMRR